MIPFHALYVCTKTDLKKAVSAMRQERGPDALEDIKPLIEKRGKMALLHGKPTEEIVWLVNKVQEIVAARLGEAYEPLPWPLPERSIRFQR